MENIKKIAVLCGGSSSEREISLQSGQGIYKALCDLGYKSNLMDFKNLEDLNTLKKYDLVFIALHGFEGEGGRLQKDLDDLNILYSGSKSEACKNTWNKGITKKILQANKINTPTFIELQRFDIENVINKMHHTSFDLFRPFENLFLKPNEDGSSVDIFKISDEESIKKAYEECTNPNRSFLIEEYIDGREITVTIIGEKCFPPVEIITDNEFYDYEAKYISDETVHVEAELSSKELIKIKLISKKVFNILGCSGWARIDFLQDKQGHFYVIEVNTVPGMTQHSNVPISGSFFGLGYNEVVQKIIHASI